MIEFQTVVHHIQKSIIDVLMYQEYARFSELRPARTDTNLFSYHLNALQKTGYVRKTDRGYGLTIKGLSYVDRVSTTKKIIRMQPKIITMLVVQNSDGDILLQKRTKQPFIDCWTLPYGKLHIDDTSLAFAAQREAFEKLAVDDQAVTHAGACYIRVIAEDDILSSTTAHIFSFHRDDIEVTDTLQWVRPHKLHERRLAPAVELIIARTFFNDPFYFEEFDVTWQV